MKRTKGQHYLLSAKARSLSLMEIMRLSDSEAFNLFRESRWSNGAPICPRCNHEKHYFIRTRKQWRCKSCNHSFSVTSGTIFANHKMPLRNYLAAIAIYANAAKGLSALQMSRDLDCQYKSAWVLVHKIRESLVDEKHDNLRGEVEIDACYTNKHVRPKNRIQDRVDRRLKENQNPKKRAVVVIRQRGEKGEGANKTLTFLTKSENQKTSMTLALANIDRSATIYADEHHSYNILHSTLVTRRVIVNDHHYGAIPGSP